MTTDSGPSLSNGTPTRTRRTLSENTPNAASDEKLTSTEAGKARPAIGKLSQWQTERPKPTAKDSTLSSRLQRHATNISALKDAVWPRPIDNEDSTTSSSSDSDLSNERTRTNTRVLARRIIIDGEGRAAGVHIRNSMLGTRTTVLGAGYRRRMGG